MKKKSDDEFGILITREMKSMMLDETIPADKRTQIFCAIVNDEQIEDSMMNAFASSLKTGYISTNNKRKAEILSRRDRQKKYQQHLRTSTEIDGDKRASTENGVFKRASLNKAKQSKVDNNIPLYPPSGEEGDLPPAIDVETMFAEGDGQQPVAAAEDGATDLSEKWPRMEGEDDETYAIRSSACLLAERIVETEAYGHMRVNRKKLMKCLISVLKKNGGAAEAAFTARRITVSLADWSERWASDDWRYAPGKITDWLYDEKWLEEPRKKEPPAVSSGCGDCGVEIV